MEDQEYEVLPTTKGQKICLSVFVILPLILTIMSFIAHAWGLVVVCSLCTLFCVWIAWSGWKETLNMPPDWHDYR